VDKLPGLRELLEQECRAILGEKDSLWLERGNVAELDDHRANLYHIALKTSFFKMMRVTNATEAFVRFQYSSRTSIPPSPSLIHSHQLISISFSFGS